jgi:DNA-binding response OmpR family regulator
LLTTVVGSTCAENEREEQLMSAAGYAHSVLYVEDEPLIREMLAVTLEDAGFEVIVVESGTAALQALDRGRYCALITDINLGPGPNGWDVAKRARELDCALPVLYVTGGAAENWHANKVRDGVILTKPFQPNQLAEAVERLVAG